MYFLMHCIDRTWIVKENEGERKTLIEMRVKEA